MVLPLSPSNRRYGRLMPPALPLKRMLSRTLPPGFPLYADLSAWDGPIKDQGEEGSCTGHTFAEFQEWVVRKYFPKLGPLIFSPQFLYALALIENGNFPSDDGSDGVTLCEVMVKYGACLLSAYPYVAGEILRPTVVQLANGQQYQINKAYHGLVGSQTAISVLGDKTPWPIAMGFTVRESLESDETANTGIYNPQPDEQVLGGHEVKVSGYDISPTPVIRPKGCPPAFKIQNSWGKDWGLDGYFWAAVSVIDDPDTDLKIVHAGGPWIRKNNPALPKAA
jgi:hypothetical protein